MNPNKKKLKEPKINYNYEIIETLTVEEGIKRIFDIPLKSYEKYETSRKYQMAEMAKTSTKCICCGVVGTKFCLGRGRNDGSLHWDLYTEDDIILTVDHIEPQGKGGKNHISNTQILCKKCNNFKGFTPERIEVCKLLYEAGLEIMMVHKGDPPYIRIGYWKRMPNELYEKVSYMLHEEEFHDEDCGDLYIYYLKK